MLTDQQQRRLIEQAIEESGAPAAFAAWLDCSRHLEWDPDASAAAVLAELIDEIGNDGSEQAERWGIAMPSCPGHRHPSNVSADGAVVLLVCPASGQEVRRIVPVLS